MIDEPVEPVEVGLLHHHGPELFPVFELIIGGALPAAAAVWLGRLRSASSRLTRRSGDGARHVDDGLNPPTPRS